MTDADLANILRRLSELEADSHPPIPIADVVREVLREEGLIPNV